MISPFSVIKFRILFASCWLIWASLHAAVLYWFQFTLITAIIDSLISNVLLSLACLMVSNTFRYYLPVYKRYSYLLAMCVFITLIWFFISRFTLKLLIGYEIEYDHIFSQSVPVRLVIAFLIIGTMILLSVLWYTLQNQQENEKRKTETEKLAKDAELYNLRQQLQPHFLFNSLNSINALIGIRPQEARNMIQQLSDFLRGTLKKEGSPWVTLQEELTHLQLYLDIEKVRFGHRLTTNITVDETSGQMRMPAMLLQPVVENAIKFGLYDTTDDITIHIAASSTKDMLIITVANPFDKETTAPNKGTGFGLSSVQRRLYLVFAQQNLLKTHTEDNIFITTISIPQQYD